MTSETNQRDMSRDWLFDKLKRIPHISDAQIAEMRHIHPVVKDGFGYRRIAGADSICPRSVCCIWDAQPVGDRFTFDTLNETTIVTQHKSSVFFKPSLAEVYAWIRLYFRKDWRMIRFFCLVDAQRISGSSDCVCQCKVMGGPMLTQGPDGILVAVDEGLINDK